VLAADLVDWLGKLGAVLLLGRWYKRVGADRP